MSESTVYNMFDVTMQVYATVGTTESLGFDELKEIGPYCMLTETSLISYHNFAIKHMIKSLLEAGPFFL